MNIPGGCGGWRFTWLSPAVAIASIWVIGTTTASSRPVLGGDFVDALESRHLIVDGILLSATDVRRVQSGGCGYSESAALPGVDYRIAVTRTLLGTADDTVVVITSLGGPRFPRASLHIGARVIGYANRLCEDGWRLWGGVIVVTEGGYLVGSSSDGDLSLPGSAKGTPVSLEQFTSAFEERLEHAGATSFNSASSVLLVRLGAFTDVPGEPYYSYACDSLGWAVPGITSAPRQIRFLKNSECFPHIGTGDTLLVPLHPEFAGQVLTTPACPGAWKISGGIAIGFGVPLGLLHYALEQSEAGIVVRPVIERPGE